MKHLFIINPVAGGKKNRHPELRQEILSLMSSVGEPFEIYITTAPMDARDKIRAAAGGDGDLRVYACGGDGTLNECVNGAAGFRNIAVTHYPCGTGNDFVKTFGEADALRFRDLRALISGSVRPIDIIDCNGRYGVNVCSVGIDARIGTDVHKYSRVPIIGGPTAYVTSLVVNFVRGINRDYKIETAGQIFEGRFALICACNGRFYGGGFNPWPDARPDDGLIDYLVITGMSRLKFLSVIGKYAKGRSRELTDIIYHFRGRKMTISSPEEFVVNIDGEAVYTDRISMDIIPGGLNFVFPAGMEFF